MIKTDESKMVPSVRFSLKVVTMLLLSFIVLFFSSQQSNSQQDHRQLDRPSVKSSLRGEWRTALVIGNAAYTNISPLKNPANDAALISSFCRG